MTPRAFASALVAAGLAWALAHGPLASTDLPAARAAPLLAPAAESQTVSMREYSFAPGQLTVARGVTVTWRNDGQAVHTTTSTGGPAAWDSGPLMPGQSWSQTFDTPGTYSYLCAVPTHADRGMRATLVVLDPTATPTRTPTPTPGSSATVIASPPATATAPAPATAPSAADAPVVPVPGRSSPTPTPSATPPAKPASLAPESSPPSSAGTGGPPAAPAPAALGRATLATPAAASLPAGAMQSSLQQLSYVEAGPAWPAWLFFPATQQYLGGAFRLRYLQDGAAEAPARLGLPITGVRYERGLLVQYLTHARLEWHGSLPDWFTSSTRPPRPDDPGAGEQAGRVLLGLLGQELLARRGERAAPVARPPELDGSPLWRYFPATGHYVALGFLAHFDAAGGVEAYGYPLTEEQREGGRTVQWFQRARFEWDEATGAVRLAALGQESLSSDR